ncbi:sel1 repeat family protein [bacterium SCSIO 12696]|nr:sel1 repeat family protein [bacterium SCSIO 12696]
MDKIQTRQILDDAKKEIEQGDCSLAYKILQPLINDENPEALYLFSMFGLSNGESIEEFEKRSVRLLTKAAGFEYPPAQYALGVYYDGGDLVEQDKLKAAMLFKAAAINGHSKAQLSYGLDLFYGSNGVKKDHILGLKYIQKAAEAGVEEAAEVLSELKE